MRAQSDSCTSQSGEGPPSNDCRDASVSPPSGLTAVQLTAFTSVPQLAPLSADAVNPVGGIYMAFPRPVLCTGPTAAQTIGSDSGGEEEWGMRRCTSSPPPPPAAAPPFCTPLSGAHRSGLLRTYKILIVGEAGVGKSNLLQRYCHNAYNPTLPSTIGAEFCAREVEIPSGAVGKTETVVLQLWDTAGQERHGGIISNAFYRNAVGAILVYDVTRRETLLNLPQWAARVTELAREDCICVVVGAKVDLLVDAPPGSTEAGALHDLQHEADLISHAMGMRNYMTSALSGEGVLETFTHLVLAVDAVQVSPPPPGEGSRDGGGTLSQGTDRRGGKGRPALLWTPASTVPTSPIGIMGGSAARAATWHLHSSPGDGTRTVSHQSSPPSLTPTTSFSGISSPVTSINRVGGPPQPPQKNKPLDLRGFGSNEAESDAGRGASSVSMAWGC